jgi:hypothetical protein
MTPDKPADIARQLQQAHEGNWLVAYGSWTHEYLGFPLWPGRGGGHVVAREPMELKRRMVLVEQDARSRAFAIAPNSHRHPGADGDDLVSPACGRSSEENSAAPKQVGWRDQDSSSLPHS